MNGPIVSTPQGKIRGCLGENYDKEKFYKFLGIPYAKPPVGDLRFKAPVPSEPWSGVLDATKESDRCYSREEKSRQIVGSEDCLYLNVYTKQLPGDGNTELKPVMFWIHGGAFVSGSGSQDTYGAEFLLIEDVVFVSINYRLGALGFLSLKDTSLGVPGNAGLKDQCLALKWVQNNIKYFGGDPENVTIFGESAGGVFVHYHVLSPQSKSLFHRAIVQSGTALNPSAVAYLDIYKFVEKLGATVSSEKEALEVLKKKPVEELFAAQEAYIAQHSVPTRPPFAPVIESVDSTNPLITKNPLEIIQSGEYNKVPLIFGYTNREGMLFDGVKRRNVNLGLSGTKEPEIEEWTLPWHLNFEKGSELYKDILKKLKETYFKSSDKADNIRLLQGDQTFVAGIVASVLNHARTSPHPVYLYRVSLEASLNFYKKICKMEDIPGVSHADELGYLFKSFLTPENIPYGSIEDISLRRFVKLWTSFAKLGKFDKDDTGLEIDWKAAAKDELNFLDIDKELSVDVDPENERIKLWRYIYRSSDSPLVQNYL